VALAAAVVVGGRLIQEPRYLDFLHRPSFAVIRAFTNFRTTAAGRGLPSGKRMGCRACNLARQGFRRRMTTLHLGRLI
jgi:hypothetical protein